MGQRKTYTLFHRALGELYGEDLLRLAADNTIDFDDELFRDVAKRIYEEKGFSVEQMDDPQVQALMWETYKTYQKAINSSLTHKVPDNVREALEENAFIFSGFKTYHSLSEVGLSLTTDEGNIKTFEQFSTDVERLNNTYNHNYLYAEYNHAVGSSLMAEKWQEFEAGKERYDLQYRTAGDENVREEHQLLDGTTLPVDDPFWDKYLPPNGWNCRCTTVQVRKGKYPTSDPDMAMKRGDSSTERVKQRIFRYNPGKTLETFPPKHPYYKTPTPADKKAVEKAVKKAEKKEEEREKQRNQEVKRQKKNLLTELPCSHKDQPIENIATGRLLRSKKTLKNLLQHCLESERLEAAEKVWLEPNVLNFERLSPLGEGKDLSKEEDRKNIENKKRRGVTHYHVYSAKIKDKKWKVKLEVHKDGFEQFYFISPADIENDN